MAEGSIQVSRPLCWRLLGMYLKSTGKHWYRSMDGATECGTTTSTTELVRFAARLTTGAREYATSPLFPYICRNLLPSDSAPGWKLRSDIAAFRRGRLFLCKVMQHGP